METAILKSRFICRDLTQTVQNSMQLHTLTAQAEFGTGMLGKDRSGSFRMRTVSGVIKCPISRYLGWFWQLGLLTSRLVFGTLEPLTFAP